MLEEVKNYAAKWFDKGREHGNALMTKDMLTELEEEGEQICQLFPKSEDNPDGYEPKAISSAQSGEGCLSSANTIRATHSEPKANEGLLTEIEKVLAVDREMERTKDCPSKMRDYSVIIATAQRDLTVSRYMQAVKDSRNGKELNLTEGEFEVFCAIENLYIDRISKVKEAEKKQLQMCVDDLKRQLTKMEAEYQQSVEGDT